MKWFSYRFKQRCLTAALATGVLFFIVLSAYAGLSDQMKNAIFTAYMNGYVDALDLDMERIKAIKSDKALMKKLVLEAAGKYVKIVDGMN